MHCNLSGLSLANILIPGCLSPELELTAVVKKEIFLDTTVDIKVSYLDILVSCKFHFSESILCDCEN